MRDIDKLQKVRRYLNDIGMYVFVNILYPALKSGGMDIDYKDVCQMYPEYRIRVVSDKSKGTRLSKTKSIIRNGWERDALARVAASQKIDSVSRSRAEDFLRVL